MYQSTKSTEGSVLVGNPSGFERKPLEEWRSAVRTGASNMRRRLAFMTAEHRAVRNFAVTGLVRFEGPLTVEEIALHVGLSVSRVQEIVVELERQLFFLVRNPAGKVAWAFPVAADRTPHEMRYTSGERSFGACAEDAFAAPFVLERLLRRPIKAEISSVCGQSNREVHLVVGGEPSSRGGPLWLFVPSVNWEEFRGPNIINEY
jgi:hypothetical protein